MKIISQIYKHQYFAVFLALLGAALFLYGVIAQASEMPPREECTQVSK
ncbi:hypothetical protein NIES4106_62330 (plasmid) [Fischerella sp. NIES-4106]|nr:hypothetical protein NIES4106_62330 [Fischerella sp. NIES-4106]